MNVVLALTEEQALRESLRAALPSTDLLLFEASAAAAVRRLISMRADALIIDDAPSLGLEAFRHVQERGPAPPAIMLSSRTDNETLAGCMLAGVSKTLAKPFNCVELRQAIDEAVSRVKPGAEMEAPAEAQPRPMAPATVNQHQIALRWMQRTASYMKDRERISQSLIDCLSDVFDAARCAVLLEEDGDVTVAASQGLPATVTAELRLASSAGLMRWFQENACLFDRDGPTGGNGAAKELHILNGRFGAPIMMNGQVRGAIVVGDKASGLDYSGEERDLVTGLARYASVVLENAGLYQDMARQRSELDAILANITAGVVAVSPARTVSMMNKSAERLLQVRAADVMGRSVQKLGSGFADVALRTLKDGKARLRQEVRDPAIDADLGLSVTPLGGGGAVVIFSKLSRKQGKAAKEDVVFSPYWEFLASRVAQEIKNPMVAINTFAQLLPKKYDSPEFREQFGDVVQQEVQRINGVVNTLFEFANHPRLTMQPDTINRVVRQVVDGLAEAMERNGVQAELELDPVPPEVSMDPLYLAQALHNVVENAIDAMPSGGTVHIAAWREEDQCCVSVRDTGPGVPEQDADQLLLPFFSTKEQGMGLGLTMAQRILKQHGGALTLSSPDDGGARFVLSLPIAEGAYADHLSHR